MFDSEILQGTSMKMSILIVCYMLREANCNKYMNWDFVVCWEFRMTYGALKMIIFDSCNILHV